MKLFDELKRMTRPYNDADGDEYEDDYEEELDDVEEPAAAPSSGRRSPFSAPDSGRESRRQSGSPPKVVNINGRNNMQVVLVKPERYDMVREIADHLRDKKTILLNLESTNKDVARRLVDFLSGCAYALDGDIKKVAISTYIITPVNVEVIGDVVEELQNNGIYF